MTTQLSTVIYEIDWDYILNNFKREELWEKEWTVYDYNNVKVNMYLANIDVENNKIILKTKVSYEGNRIHSNVWYWNDDIQLPLSQEHRNLEIFNRKLYSELVKRIKDVERHLIKRTTQYSEAVELDNKVAELWEQEAENFLDDEGVTNEVIREAYVDHHKRKMSDNYDSYEDKVFEEMLYKTITPCYLMNAHLNGKEDDVETYVVYTQSSIEDIIAELDEELKNFDIQSISELSKESLEDLD